MRLLSRTIFREIFVSAILGSVLFTFALFLQQARPLFEFLVRASGTPSTVAYLFSLVLPAQLPFTIPLGVLVGTLITLSRMSTDGEITAMRAAGIPGRRVVPAIVTFGFLAMLLTAAASLWLTPWSIRESYRVRNQVLARQLTADVQPRVFEEQFPNTILYVNDVVTGPTPQWKRIVLFDITPPNQRKPGTAERGDSPRITLASDAQAVPDIAANRLTLSLRNSSTYEAGKAATDYHISASPIGDQALEAQKPAEVHPTRPSPEMDSLPLYREAYHNRNLNRDQILEDRIELNRRLAVPLACMLLALVAVPLGVTSRRAGKSAAVVLTAALAFIYYLGLIVGVSLARQRALRPEIAMWIPDVLFAVFGVVMIVRLEIPGDFDFMGSLTAFFRFLRQAPKDHVPRMLDRIGPRVWLARFPLLPQLIDTYVLTSFIFYFVVLLASFVLMYHVFTFFSLMTDIIRNHPAMSRVLSYHLFLTPRLIYQFAPIGVLTAVLVCFGVLTKHNEVTAMKACGVSVYRLTVPILAASLLLSVSLFLFDHYWVPEADRRQDALYNEIKGKPPQTYLRMDRKFVYGLQDRVYNYNYFDPVEHVMAGVNVYEIDSATFRLKRHISAERARWEPGLNAWVFQNGWSCQMDRNIITNCDNFTVGPNRTRTFSGLEEPSYFVHEQKQSEQMNFLELKDYINELTRSGFDTVALQVQYYKKFSVPLFALIMAMVSIPFAFIAGNRGAMAGVGLSFILAIAYFSVGQLFQQVGNLSQLPAQIAAWSPDVIFSLAGMYFLARMRT